MSTGQYCYKQNRFQQLRGFCYSAAAGSISAGARRLSLSQPSVTQQIQALEREMGVQLFNRRQGGIRLTHDGEVLFKMSMPLVEQMETLDERFGRIRFGQEACQEGTLSLAAGGSTLLRVLPSAIERFRSEHPRIELRLHNISGSDGLAMLRAGGIDLAVGPMQVVPPDLEFYQIASYAQALITAQGHPLQSMGHKITLEQVSRYPLVLPPKGISTRALVDSAFKKRGLICQVAVEVGGWEVIKKYVEMGVGLSIVTSSCLTGSENLGVIAMDEIFPNKSYGIILKKNASVTKEARWFIALLLSSK